VSSSKSSNFKALGVLCVVSAVESSGISSVAATNVSAGEVAFAVCQRNADWFFFITFLFGSAFKLTFKSFDVSDSTSDC